jgi:hypothetical protein
MNRPSTSPRSFSTDQLRAALRDVGEPARPGYLPDIVAQAGRMRQRPAWTFLEGWRTMLGLPRTIPTMPRTFAWRAVGAVAIVIVAVVGLTFVRQPAVGPGAELGIFEPVAGRILSGLWGESLEAVDPTDPARSTILRVGPESVLALGWSRDGTKLLFLRKDQATTDPFDANLFILHADGTESQVTPEPVGGAAISPDGSQVVFAGATDGDDGLYVIDAEGGRLVRIGNGEEPTFSPDGAQIAYLGLPRDGCCVEAGREHVWVANADGTDAHEILADEPALAQGGQDLTWSPAGDRIAMVGGDGEQNPIYTFAPDGSDFAKVITDGINPFWSPDGSQIAYLVPYGEPQLGRTSGLAIADADGSNVREFGFGASGPWHPGIPAIDEPAPSLATTAPAEMSPSPPTESAAPGDAALPDCTGTVASDDALTVGWCPTRPDGQQVGVAFRLTTRGPGWLNGEQSGSQEALFFRPYGYGVQPGGKVAVSVGGPAILEDWLALITGEAAYTVSEPQPISLGGADGYAFDVSTAPGHADVGDAPRLIDSGAISWEVGGTTSRVWLVDHDGQPIMFVARPNFAGVTSWGTWVGDILQTIEWD